MTSVKIPLLYKLSIQNQNAYITSPRAAGISSRYWDLVAIVCPSFTRLRLRKVSFFSLHATRKHGRESRSSYKERERGRKQKKFFPASAPFPSRVSPALTNIILIFPATARSRFAFAFSRRTQRKERVQSGRSIFTYCNLRLLALPIGQGLRSSPGGGTPLKYLYGYVPTNGVLEPDIIF